MIALPKYLKNTLLLLIGLGVGGLLHHHKAFTHQQQLVAQLQERVERLENPQTITDKTDPQFVKASQEIKKSIVGVVVTPKKSLAAGNYIQHLGRFYYVPPEAGRPHRVMGSGIVIDTNGFILTNYHVVQNAQKVRISFPSGKSVDATIAGVDQLTDLAVLKISKTDSLTLIPVDYALEKDLRVGQWVLAVGNPYLNFIRNADPTITAGVVSALHRNFAGKGSILYQDMIQTDAAINPGNSGGALINLKGKVVGINTFVYNQNGENALGLGFSIPMERAMKVARELIIHGHRRSIWTGIGIKALDNSTTAKHTLVVREVVKGGPGDKAGIRPDDTLIAVGVRMIREENDLKGLFLAYFPGDTINVLIKRGEREIDSPLILQEYRSQ